MAMKILQNLKKIKKEEFKNEFNRFVIVGTDLFAVSAYQFLKENYPGDQVKILASREIEARDLRFPGPSSIRGKQRAYYQQNFPENSFELCDQTSLFYKEQLFSNFGGRRKSESLLAGEEYYTFPKGIFDLKNHIKGTIDFSGDTLVSSVSNIKKTTSDNLLEKTNWSLDCSDGRNLSCEFLIWTESPALFSKLYQNMNELSESFIEFCESTTSLESLFVEYTFKRKISDQMETIFIPLSQTHEWGHFFGDFEDLGEKQKIEFLHFFDKDEISEDDVAKKIRILEKTLEKIYPDFTSQLESEFVSVKSNTASSDIRDEGYFASLMPGLTFLGINAPIDSPTSEGAKPSHLVRGLISFKLFTESFKKKEL